VLQEGCPPISRQKGSSQRPDASTRSLFAIIFAIPPSSSKEYTTCECNHLGEPMTACSALDTL
jgi:hypothetical protein